MVFKKVFLLFLFFYVKETRSILRIGSIHMQRSRRCWAMTTRNVLLYIPKACSVYPPKIMNIHYGLYIYIYFYIINILLGHCYIQYRVVVLSAVLFYMVEILARTFSANKMYIVLRCCRLWKIILSHVNVCKIFIYV